MHSLDLRYVDRLRIPARDASALQALGAHRGRQELFCAQTPQLLDGLRTAALVESTESSNRIEGIVAAPARVEALVRRHSEPRDRPEEEIAGYRDALELIHESAQDLELTSRTVLRLHRILYRHQGRGLGGRWKLSPNEIVERDPSGAVTRVRFVPPSPRATPGMIDQLELRYARASDQGREPLILVPLAILDLLCIHPFSDGNGRTARLVTLLLLYRAGYEVGRYISLERVIEESRVTYYEALERSSRRWHQGQHDSLPWLRYFWGVLIRAYVEFEERVGNLGSGRGVKSDFVEQAVFRRVGPFSIADIEHDAPGVSRVMIKKVLARLRDERRIALQGRGRGARWRIA